MWHAAPLMMGELATYSPSSKVQSARSDTLNTIQGSRKQGSLTDEDRPDIDEDEERDVRKLLQREDVWKDVIWYALRKAIQWMERMACVRGGHDPFVMRFVQSLVNQRVVQPPMDPIDEEIGEEDEEGELNDVVERERSVRGRVVKFSIAEDFAEEDGGGEDGHQWDGGEGLFDLLTDLVLEVFRVCEGCVVENEDIGEGGAKEIDDSAEDTTPGSERPGGDV